ncbi:MAG: hypothetical protein MJ159_03760 [Treponemataceae bacterium]|nr:hypothetical protein [Treponemataceae bacterium]
MKKNYNIFIFIFILILSGCENKNDYIKNAWTLSKEIDFNKTFIDNKKIINKTLLNFRKAQDIKNSDWEDGYIQEIQFYVAIYYRNLIAKDTFLNYTRAVYDKYYVKHQDFTKNKFSYSIFQYLDGRIEESFALLKTIYKKDYVYNLKELSNSDIKNFICGILLGDIEPSEYEETVYYEFCHLSEDDLIEMLQITW